MSIYAKSSTGFVWYLQAIDEVPTLVSGRYWTPRGTLYESPTFFSTNRQVAKQWRVTNAGVFFLQDAPLPQGTVEYIEFKTPSGVSWVVGLNDDGTLYTELFTSAVPKQRRLVTTVMHRGTHVWVADNRFPPP